MKIIIAAYPKTGTKSLEDALKQLGYKVYHFPQDHYHNHDQWKKILLKGGTKEDFRRLYEDVDVAFDAPAFYFWEEIAEAFPDAKIIYMTRDEESWYNSINKQVNEYFVNKRFVAYAMLSSTLAKICALQGLVGVVCYGAPEPPLSAMFTGYTVNKLLITKKFRNHNGRVLQEAPAEKLLKFDVRSGWEPLCAFLEKEVPNKPFPHKNKNSTLIDDLLRESPIFQKCKDEAHKKFFIFFALIFALFAFMCLFFTKSLNN